MRTKKCTLTAATLRSVLRASRRAAELHLSTTAGRPRGVLLHARELRHQGRRQDGRVRRPSGGHQPGEEGKELGILFIPEGKYKISKTIYIPAPCASSATARAPGNHPGQELPGLPGRSARDKGKAKYMFWFTGNMVEEGVQPRDAGAGTFYSAMSNIDLRIEDGNPPRRGPAHPLRAAQLHQLRVRSHRQGQGGTVRRGQRAGERGLLRRRLRHLHHQGIAGLAGNDGGLLLRGQRIAALACRSRAWRW